MTRSAALFPRRERVIFDSNPLIEVVCQVRFPAILKIDAELPAEFQEAIRGSFPQYQRQVAIGVPELPEALSKMLGGGMPQNNSTFLSADADYRIGLSSSSVSLTATKYVDWGIFKDLLSMAIDALNKTYSPSYFERIGLRYRNLIKRSEIGLAETDWRELLNPTIAAELVEEGWAQHAFEVQRALRAPLNDSGDNLFFQHGFAREGSNQEIFYLLDFDYYSQERSEADNVIGTIERLHDFSGSAFQWCISEKLRMALRPRC